MGRRVELLMMGRMHVWLRRGLVAVLGLVALRVVAEVAMAALRMVVWRTHWQPGIEFLRRFNKRIENRAYLKRPGKWVTIVHHTGRTSGTAYATPVWAERSGESFFIQLPYGTDVDWCRNVLAAGGCALERNGVRADTVAPVIVPADEAMPLLPPGLRRMHRLADVRSYLRLATVSTDVPTTRAG